MVCSPGVLNLILQHALNSMLLTVRDLVCFSGMVSKRVTVCVQLVILSLRWHCLKERSHGRQTMHCIICLHDISLYQYHAASLRRSTDPKNWAQENSFPRTADVTCSLEKVRILDELNNFRVRGSCRRQPMSD